MTIHHKARSSQFQQVVNITNTYHVSLIVSHNLGETVWMINNWHTKEDSKLIRNSNISGICDRQLTKASYLV